MRDLINKKGAKPICTLERNSSKMAKKIISYALVLILIVLLATSVLCTILSSTILNEKFALNILDQNEYYSKIYNEIMQNFKNNTIQSGLEESILDGTISEEQVKSDVVGLINSIYENKQIKVDAENVKNKLQENINAVIAENNKRVSKDEQEEIDIYVNTIGNIYKDGILYADDYIPGIQNAIAKIKGMIEKGKIILYIVAIVILIITIVLNKIESIKYISITAISTGLLLTAIKVIEIVTMKTQNILILNQAFSKIVINVIEEIISKCLLYGVVLIVVGMLLNIISSFKLNKVEK